MARRALFRFHGNLNDFLQVQKRNQELHMRFNGQPSLMDAIESLGIPHVAIGEVKVNGISKRGEEVDWDKAIIDVWPINQLEDKQDTSFLADDHLGKLAKLLRMVGFDTLYLKVSAEKELIDIANHESRLLLTRSINLLKHGALRKGYWVRSEDPEKQLREVMKQLGLSGKMRPFSRCLSCNGIILPVDKRQVLDLLPPLTIQYFNEFYQCTFCKKVYWKGSHYERMMKLISELEA